MYSEKVSSVAPFIRSAFRPVTVLHHVGARRALHWGAVVLLGPNLVLSTVRSIANPEAYQFWFIVTVLTVLWGLLTWALVACLGARSATTPITAILATSCLALVAHPAAYGSSPPDYPPLFHVLGASLCTSIVAGFRVSVWLIPIFSAYVAFLRTPELGVAQAIAEAGLLATSAFLASATVIAFDRANRIVGDAVVETRRATVRSMRASRRAFERQHWNGLVHDKVLGALREARTAEGSVPSSATWLAGQALAALAGESASERIDLRGAIADYAQLMGLTVIIDLRGEPDPEVQTVVQQAIEEALTNVARHSGANTASVVGALGPQRVDISIIDTGTGFVASLGEDRVGGLRISQERMRSIGGDLVIASVPGRGATVRLTWRAPTEIAPAHWQLHAFAPVMWIGGVALVLNLSIGAPQWLHNRSLPVALLGIVGIVAVTFGAAFGDHRGRFWKPLVISILALTTMLSLNIAPGAVADWRYWFLGALTAATGATAFRFRPWAGVCMAFAMTVIVCVVDVVSGRNFWTALGGPVPVLLGTAIGGQLVRKAMDDVWRRVEQAQSASARMNLDAAIESEREREASSRVAALAANVGPALRLIMSRSTLSTDERHELELLEAAARDHLAQPDLLDADLVQTLRDARRRGVQVVVAPASETTEALREPEAGLITRYRQMLILTLTAVSAGSQVRAAWASGNAQVRATISLVSTDPESVRSVDALLRAIPEPAEVRMQITSDEDSLLVRLDSREQVGVRRVADSSDLTGQHGRKADPGERLGHEQDV